MNSCSPNWPTNCQYFWSKSASTSLLCSRKETAIALPYSDCQPWTRSTLLQATTNGVLACLNIRIDSRVCGLQPSTRSITKMAMSASDPPRVRRVEKEWCPGVSINRRPGELKFFPPISGAQRLLRTSEGTSVAPICCVIPPASLAITEDCLSLPSERMWSSRLVLPWSTWPRTATMGCLLSFIHVTCPCNLNFILRKPNLLLSGSNLLILQGTKVPVRILLSLQHRYRVLCCVRYPLPNRHELYQGQHHAHLLVR